MIVGSGNDRPTPRIILDILGHNSNRDPEPLSFVSLGEGAKQHNMETSLANAKQSLITMMQVYEYFISHHMAKAFKSLFGLVTCLPGRFTVYRLRTPDTHKPPFISNPLIHDYSENRVGTLHMKNLLHLGEGCYLTTLLLKDFPTYKTQFIRCTPPPCPSFGCHGFRKLQGFKLAPQ